MTTKQQPAETWERMKTQQKNQMCSFQADTSSQRSLDLVGKTGNALKGQFLQAGSKSSPPKRKQRMHEKT